MLDTIMGVPAHALIVHATVVLLPLAALGGIAIALVPALRRRYGPPVGLLALVALVLVPLTTRSGEHLFDRRSAQFGPGDTTEAGLMERHADLAEGLLPWVIVLVAGVALVLAVPLLARRRGDSPRLTKVVAAGAAVLTLVGGAMTLVQVVRIGHAGAEAAWSRVDQAG